ncbi:hypothetical protein H2201_005628 [Coniosporium apollinis]|uniref:ATP synthase mitochondrial F1 complex assembly factor 1 n=1 Tax=Coniosporium apollinis TaxID=61459 RepID=A0ABQ9NRD0_9PEZI|nr:hypothetical protein H2201_005628 [Coniosporium apollinis]
MASLNTPAIRHLLRQTPPLRVPQRRWARVHDVRFLATHRTRERILAKYRDKLDRKAKEEGHGSVDELTQAYKDKIASLRKQAAVPGATAPLGSANPQAQTQNLPFHPPPPPQHIADLASSTGNPTTTPPSPSPSPKTPAPPPGVKTLSSYLDLAKTADLPTTEIEYIWRLRHASSPSSLCAVIPSRIWDQIRTTASRHPQFILPLPREGQGAEIHFLQWTFPHPNVASVLFTHLAEYKLRGEFASPHTTVNVHLELKEDKGVALVQGQVVEGRGVSVEEAKWLLMCLQKFYGLQGEEESRRRLLEQFSKGDGGFRVEELLEEAEKIV